MKCDCCKQEATSQYDCFELALESLKNHYNFCKNILQQRTEELKQVKERNVTLSKALHLLQNEKQPNKRFKTDTVESPEASSTHKMKPNEAKGTGSGISSDISLPEDDDDDDMVGASNLNIALHSEQLFETSALRSDVSISSSEMITSPGIRESPKRNRQRDDHFKKKKTSRLDNSTTAITRNKSNAGWASKFLQSQSAQKETIKNSVDNQNAAQKKPEKKPSLSLKKTNPSKIKQTLLNFDYGSKGEGLPNNMNAADDIINPSPMANKSGKLGRTWSNRNETMAGLNNSSNATSNDITNDKDQTSLTLDFFDFSPSKKTPEEKPTTSGNCREKLVFGSEEQMPENDCTALAKQSLCDMNVENSDDSSSVLILTPATQDIIFIEDEDDIPDIDTMALADLVKRDSMESLKELEKETMKKQQKNEPVFKKPKAKEQKAPIEKQTTLAINKIKQEKVSENKLDSKVIEKVENNAASTSATNIAKVTNPLFSTEEETDEDDDDFMPLPIKIKMEPEKPLNRACEECEKIIKFLGASLTKEQIQQQLRQCHHNNADLLANNTPEDFWNPMLLSFSKDDPRNEVLIDTRFKDKKQQN